MVARHLDSEKRLSERGMPARIGVGAARRRLRLRWRWKGEAIEKLSGIAVIPGRIGVTDSEIWLSRV